MDNFLYARLLTAFALAFHIIFAASGVALPFLIVIAYRKYLKTQDTNILNLVTMWSKLLGVIFAIGAATGTMISFHLGLLWSPFMKIAGPVIGFAFGIEGIFFFLEAIFLGLFLYAPKKISPKIHFISIIIVAFSALSSAFIIVAINGWMNSPAGFELINGEITNFNPKLALFNRSALHLIIHMVIAAFQAVGFSLAGIHALALLKDSSNQLHLSGLKIALAVAVVASFLQLGSGDFSERQIKKLQPIKFAASELILKTGNNQPFVIGGLPNQDASEITYAIQIPSLLSVMTNFNLSTEIKGVDNVAEELRPPLALTHITFQVMVGCGVVLSLVSMITIILVILQRPLINRSFLKLLLFCSPLGFIGLEAGWCVTEVGRQPWIIYNVLKTVDAVTQTEISFLPSLIGYLTLYGVIGISFGWVVRKICK